MIPREFRLDVVAGKLATQLDGVRRAFDSPGRRREVFDQRAGVYLDQVAGNWRVIAGELDLEDDPQVHIAFLRQELLQGFLPRFHKATDRVAELEAGGFGLGDLTGPLARIGLAVGGLFLAWFSFRVLRSTLAIPVAMVFLALPGLPEVLRLLAIRRYRVEVEEILLDLGRLQDAAIEDRSYRPLEDALRDLDTADEPRPGARASAAKTSSERP